MKMDNAKFAVIALSSFGEYRRSFVRLLADEFSSRLFLYSGKRPISKGVRILHEKETRVKFCTQITILGNLYLLKFPFRTIFFAKIVVLDLNPRILSNWPIIVLRRLFRRKTFLWGHAFPIRGRSAKSEKLRNLMRSLASGIFTYTYGECNQLRRIHPRKEIHCIPNSLYLNSELGFATNTKRSRILFVGRMIEEKKPQFLLDSFMKNSFLFPGVVLTLVGDGPLLHEMKLKAKSSIEAGYVEFYGHVNDLDVLKKLYAEALFSISPGYVGLSLTQSLGFGVPMLISRSENHSPEIDLAVENENTIFFQTDSADSLVDSMKTMSQQREFWQSKGTLIANKCSETYSINQMYDAMSSVIRVYLNED